MTTKLSSTSSSDRRAPLIRFWARSALFAGLLAVMLAGVEWWVGEQSVSPEELRYRTVFQPGNFPQIILGTSHAANGIDPRHLEDGDFKPFNFAFNASSARFYQRWYPIYRQHHAAPQVILMSVDWVMLRESQGSRKLEHDSEFLPLSIIGSLAGDRDVSPEVLLSNRFALIKERDALQARLFRQESWSGYDLSRYHRGFAPYWRKHPSIEPPAPFPPIRPDQVEAMDALLATFKRDGAKVVLIQSPEYQAPTSHDEDVAIYEQMARRHGLPFLNYNRELRSELNNDAGLFNDWQHLNERGAARFSQKLHHDLARLGVIAEAKPRAL